MRAAQPRGLDPKYLTVPLPLHPATRSFPGSPKRVYQGTAVFFKEPQVATFLTTLPHTRSPALLLFLPQSRHPATGLGALGGWEGSQQPSCGLCSARCDLSHQNGQKNPQKNKAPKAPQPWCAGFGSSAAQLPAPHRPVPGEQPGCALPDPQHCLAKEEENPNDGFLVMRGGKIINKKGSLAPQNPGIPSGGLERSPEGLPAGSGVEGRPALPSRDRLGTGQRCKDRAGGQAGGLLPPLPGRRRRKKRGTPGRFQPATILCGGLKRDAEEGGKKHREK